MLINLLVVEMDGRKMDSTKDAWARPTYGINTEC